MEKEEKGLAEICLSVCQYHLADVMGANIKSNG
jgi:hypothetical protein